jgi:hypothetical protein
MLATFRRASRRAAFEAPVVFADADDRGEADVEPRNANLVRMPHRE